MPATFFNQPWLERRYRPGTRLLPHGQLATPAAARSSSSTTRGDGRAGHPGSIASSISAAVMMYGGSSRTTVSAVRFTSSLCERRFDDRRGRPIQIESPHQSRAADFAHAGWRDASACSLAAERGCPTRGHVRHQSRVDELFEKHQCRSACQQVAAVGAAVIAGRSRCRDAFA